MPYWNDKYICEKCSRILSGDQVELHGEGLCHRIVVENGPDIFHVVVEYPKHEVKDIRQPV
jgi:hypothetical protein